MKQNVTEAFGDKIEAATAAYKMRDNAQDAGQRFRERRSSVAANMRDWRNIRKL